MSHLECEFMLVNIGKYTCINKQVRINKIFEHKFVNIFLTISLNICFVCSKEPSHRDGSFEYPQHMFWLKNKKMNF